ncbi:hypothetical protein HSACCH_02648 [Halanaerobium saccharolyticum subsp. saccharolyticum DSM 6643]|uniref:YhaN AAA domain-containing protein n=1 Tax=Halanaerobium saccharolyticum subsp. saccharolyticum DSM 6643 TaxID=1293054 RepID=M5E4E7_9FIRM|nr:AAA family ATPase [Halanaerobium saccharolyticum]CCU81193.1 hypothetical protein HSACCH_02648 [Halanaerobium saccharolyticum subsp. saccharolyticum DSM 6643]
MKIKSFETEIFAGINNRSYQFEDGLNILLGANEAGKSTIINAIYASLFIKPQIKLNTTEGREFKEKFLPYPDGDFAEAELKIEVDNLDYKFYKKWSNNNYAGYLELADGRRIENPKKILEYKKDILPYAKSTYNNIVFSSQQDIKSTLERINSEQNPELIDTINSFLRKAVMELDGISIDKFRSKLEAEIEQLSKKWDLDSDSVTNSDRGVNNPYKVGTGKIYDSYIAKEKLRQKLKESKVNEKKFEELGAEIKKLKTEEKALIEKIEELSKIESEINQRAALELQIKNIKEESRRLTEISKKWPQLKNDLSNLEREMEKLNKKITNLESEKVRAEKLEEKKKLEKRLNKIKLLNSELNELNKKISKIIIDKAKVEKLEKYKNKITESKASLKASKLKAKINFSAAEEINIISGVESEKSVSEGEIIEAEGYIRIKTDQIDIEIESAEIDFPNLKQEFEENQQEFIDLKNKLGVNSLTEAREKLTELNDLKRKVKEKGNKIEEILGADKIEDLEAKLIKLKNLDTARKLETITYELKKLNDEAAELKTKIKIMESKLDEWIEEYQSLDQLNLSLTQKKKKLVTLKNKLDELASLPEVYDSSQAFIADLKQKRAKRESINQVLREKIEQHKDLENILPEASSKEMESELRELKNEFKNLKQKAHSLNKIKKVFEKKLKEMDQDSFAPLVKSFSKNLQQLTVGKYKRAIIEDDFSVKLQSEQKRELPGNLDLLSYGTYDAAALALRFAIFDNLFSDYGGFIILDDCLVNLDPQRRKNAVDLINQYQQKYQIIYTTCDPERADEFEANIINI